ncbi:MAG: hypothetical protein HFF84_11790 [Oscillibacter sp.]|nr:hypothetical protein [Oscillibacter sp.]
MKEKVNALAVGWKADKLRGSLMVCWVITVFSSFFGSYLLPIAVPALGSIFLFRIALPIAAVLYILYAIREKEAIWRGVSALEKWCYVFAAVMLVYAAGSLFRAMDFMRTFRMLFNLCFDMCFFLLMLRLCRDKQMRRVTLYTVAATLAVLCLLGIYEIFFGGIFSPKYNDFKRFEFLGGIYQLPVVSYENTNDYTSSVVFSGITLFLSAAVNWKSAGRKLRWGIVAGFSALYFLSIAGSARLVLAGFWAVFIGFTVFLLVSDRKRLWIPLAILVLIAGTQFGCKYYYISGAIRQYRAQMEEYHNQPENAGQTAPPKFVINTPTGPSLEEEFFTTNEETGEQILRSDASGGIRASLLRHALNCLVYSKGLGVGVGNTSGLCESWQVMEDGRAWSIHCFIARILADYGIFILIPLCAIAFLLLKSFLLAFWQSYKRHDRHVCALSLLYFLVLLAYPFLSTSSSDAQDSIAMWIYLAAVVLFSLKLTALGKEEPAIEDTAH